MPSASTIPDLPHDNASATYNEMVDAEVAWRELPKGVRQEMARGNEATKTMDKVAKYFPGMKLETAQDYKAFSDILGTKIANGAPSPVFRDLGLQARNNGEGLQQLQQTVEQIKRDPYNGWRGVLRNAGINPAWLVQPHELAQGVPEQYRHLVPQAQPPVSRAAVYGRATLEQWELAHPDVDDDMYADMAEIVRSPGFKKDKSVLRTLSRAHKAAKARRGQKSHRQRANEGLDAAVSSAASKVFG